MTISGVQGVTLVVGVSDMGEALSYYGQLFGRQPDFILAPDFQEFEVIPGMWFQLTTRVRPGKARRTRFGVADIEAERAALIEAGIDVTPVDGEPGVVAWCEFTDPFGNPLGFFQDLDVHPNPELLAGTG